MSKLYALGEKYKTFNQFIDAALESDENAEDDLQMYIDTLEAIEDEFGNKVENIAKFLKNIQADIKAFKEEEDRLKKKRGYLTNKFEGLKSYTQSVLEVNKIDHVNAGTFKVKLQTSPPSVNIIDASKIPSKYKAEQEPKIDSKGLLADMKNGVKVEGVVLVSDKKHLRIS
ncbi:siphovirus Gp157 family protein [Paenibacillus sp. NPDC057886]|uniref:siphovirus Gp157 family protein n=1 Tax=Paenibacillus sp. NPDC057886 TaxID=3346270 RepID=UPI0036C110BB